MPYDPSVETKVELDNGTVLTFPAGMPLAQIQASVQRANQLPPGLPTIGARRGPRASTEAFDIAQNAGPPAPEDPTAGGLTGAAMKGISTGLSFIPGVGTGPTIARILGPAIAHAIGAKAEGQDPLADFNFQSLIGTGAEGVARALPYATNAAALASGGFVSRAKGSFGKTVRAFTRENERRAMPILPGRGEKGLLSGILPDTKTALNKAGQGLEAAEKASPATLNVRDLEIGPQSHANRLPVTEREARTGFNADTISEQTMERTLRPLLGPGVTDEQLRDFWAHGPQLPPGLNPAGMAQKFREWLKDNTMISTRDAGELQRSMSRTASPALEAARQGQASYMAPEAAERANDMINNLRSWRHGPADVGPDRGALEKFMGAPHKPGQGGAITDADQTISRLKTMDDANHAMRSGSFLTDPGALATRVAMGSGVARLVGADPLLGGTAGLLALNPEVISALGYLMSKGTRMAPGVYRGAETADELMNPPSKKPIRRRTP